MQYIEYTPPQNKWLIWMSTSLFWPYLLLLLQKKENPGCSLSDTQTYTHTASPYSAVPQSDVFLSVCSFPISQRFCGQHCFLERSWCRRACGCYWTLTAGRKPLVVSSGARTSCQQRELSFSPHTESSSKGSRTIRWVKCWVTTSFGRSHLQANYWGNRRRTFGPCKIIIFDDLNESNGGFLFTLPVDRQQN